MPRCLRLHVKQIEVQGYEEKEDELKPVKYLLKNSKVLKRMNDHQMQGKCFHKRSLPKIIDV